MPRWPRGSFYACAIDEGQVKCWGNQTDKNGYTIPSPPKLKNPRQVALGVRHICASNRIHFKSLLLN